MDEQSQSKLDEAFDTVMWMMIIYCAISLALSYFRLDKTEVKLTNQYEQISVDLQKLITVECARKGLQPKSLKTKR